MMDNIGFVADVQLGKCVLKLDCETLNRLNWEDSDFLKIDVDPNKNSITISNLEDK